MGGFGSGRYADRRRTLVEGCRRLDVRDLRRVGVIRSNCSRAGELHWVVKNRSQGVLQYEVQTSDEDGWIHLHGERLAHHNIDLDRTLLHNGGWRWWFRCPGNGCGCRAKILYANPVTIPPGGETTLTLALKDGRFVLMRPKLRAEMCLPTSGVGQGCRLAVSDGVGQGVSLAVADRRER